MKNIFSHPVRAKGAAGETWIANRICKDIRGLGYNKIIIKCDQEPSIVEIQKEVIRRCEAETIPENSPTGESQSNGDIENAIKQVEGQIRTMKVALESRL